MVGVTAKARLRSKPWRVILPLAAILAGGTGSAVWAPCFQVVAVTLTGAALAGCAVRRNPPCAEYDDPRPWCNPPQCGCDIPWAPQLDPCCNGQTTEVRAGR